MLSFDEVLDDITLYWLTATATSAARLYWESWDKDWGMMKVDIPVGYSIFPGEIFRAPQDLLSHQRFSSRMALLCLKTGHHLWTPREHARQRSRLIGLITLNTWMIGNIGTSTRVSLSKAPVRDDDMESVDDQIQVSWPGSNSVSGDRNAGSCRGRSRDQTLVGAGRSPSTARRRYSPIRTSADS